MQKDEFISLVIKRLKIKYGNEMHTSLNHETPWQLLIATILSAQSQDIQVNKITGNLFGNFKSVKAFAAIRPSELYPYVRTLGLYRSKSKHIVDACRSLLKEFNGVIPKTIAELTRMPGVGRKTANVVLSNAFGINEGIAIDTHCVKVANRLGLVRTKDPKKVEIGVMESTPRKDWGNVSLLFIALGRDVCTARVTHCERCVLNDICPSSYVKSKRGASA